MVDKEYSQIFNRFGHEQALFSQSISSMAKLGRLNKLKKGVPNPYYRGKEEVGKVEVPSELFNLLFIKNVDIDLLYFGDGFSQVPNRDYAFRASIVSYGEDSVHIDIYYGIESGIQDIVVLGANQYHCQVSGFSISSFVDVLNSNKLESFVLEHCSLDQSQKDRIRKYGL